MSVTLKVRICEHCKTEWCTKNTACPNCGSVESCLYMPTEEEIRIAKARIQAGWSRAERRRREGGNGWVPAEILHVTDVSWHNGHTTRISVGGM